MKKALGIIFSNIYDNALGELTSQRTVASLPFGGRYRQIDFVLSNMSNSGIHKIGLITKYNYRSLMDHLGSCSAWDLDRKNEGLVFIPPFSTGHSGIYKGKLEALNVSLPFVAEANGYDYVVLSDTTVLCNIDYRAALDAHIKSGADITVIAQSARNCSADKHDFVLSAAKRSGKVTDILINSKAPASSYVGMGMFIMSRELLIKSVEESVARGFYHFERDFIQEKFSSEALKVYVHEFDGVVLRNNNIINYYKNNLSLANPDIRNGLFLPNTPIYTKVHDETPSHYADGSCLSNCIVADGCVFHGKVEDSVIFRDVSIEKDACVKGCIIMQGASIGCGAHLECVIIDKNVTVRPGATLIGTPEHPVIVKKGEIV